MFGKKKSEAADGQSYFHKYANINYVAIAIAACTVILADAEGWLDDLWNPLHHLIKELAFASLVAMALILSIERFSKKLREQEIEKQISEINKNLLNAVYKRRFQPAVIREVECGFFSSNVAREGLRLTYHLTRRKNEDSIEVVQCDYKAFYFLRNITGRNIDHPLHTFAELPMSADPQCQLLSVKINYEPTDPDKWEEKLTEQKSVTRDSDDMQIKFTTLIYMKRNASVAVEIRGRLIKGIYDTEIWCTLTPADGCRLTVNVPKADLLVKARAYNSMQLEAEEQDSETLYVWNLKSGMFPHQSIVLWWRPIEAGLKGLPHRSRENVSETPQTVTATTTDPK